MLRFIVTYDYLCPFARNANEAVLSALAGGKEWEVSFRPFSLNQVHVHEGDPSVWDRPGRRAGVRCARHSNGAWRSGTASLRPSPRCTAPCSPPVTTRVGI